MGKKSSRNFALVGAIKVRWRRLRDGRTVVDPRRYGRKLLTFSDSEEAQREARRIALEIHQGGAEVSAMTTADRAAWAQVQKFAIEYNMTPVEAVAEWKAARDAVGKYGLVEAAKAGVAALDRPIYKVPKLVEEFLASKKPTDYDRRTFTDFTKILGAFAVSFPGDIQKVEASQIQDWLKMRKRSDGKELSAKRSNEILQIVGSLFLFARKRGKLPDVLTAPQLIERADVVRQEISFYSPEEMMVILDLVDPKWIPWPVMVAFNGIRTEEVGLGKHAAPRKDCLRWEDFDWKEREVCIREEVAKTGDSRRVPIQDCTWKFLTPWRDAKAKGPVLPDGDVRGQIDLYRARFLDRLRKLAPKREDITARLAEWPSNALRHSYGSYRMAILGNVEKLAYEMGDSAAMIRRHYHNPRPRSHAEAFFAIEPSESCRNLILFPANGAVSTA